MNEHFHVFSLPQWKNQRVWFSLITLLNGELSFFLHLPLSIDCYSQATIINSLRRHIFHKQQVNINKTAPTFSLVGRRTGDVR